MKHSYCKRYAMALALAGTLALSLLSGCGSEAARENDGTSARSGSAGTETVPAAITESPAATAVASSTAPASTEVDQSDATVITLNGDTASVRGEGAAASGSEVTISKGGTYSLSGSLNDGRVLIHAKGEDVTLILDGAEIFCSYGSPIYSYKAASVTLHLAEGTENALTDGASYSFSDEFSSAEEDEPNACLYSKSDLVIQGTGSLTVNGNYNNGITGKDTLQIIDAAVTVNAVNHGITGKDSADLSGAALRINCGGDALRSTQTGDSALGWIRLSGTELNAVSGEDGVQAETVLIIDGGACSLTTGGGHDVHPSDSTSAKGLKAGGDISISDGVFSLDCSDDAVHAGGTILVSGGTWETATYDDAFHADESLGISGGEINISACYEGLEASEINVSGGTIHLVSSDDGVNAGGGGDQSGFGGFGGGGMWGFAADGSSINISGGYLSIAAGGDGVDSNGDITMSGGTVIVSSSGNADGALDYNGSFTLTGGTLLAIGGGMPEAPSDVSQCTVYVGLGTTLSKGTAVALESGSKQIVFALPVNASTFVYSSPALEPGADYTISYGGNYSGSYSDTLGSGGNYSGGTELTTLTLGEGLTTYGSTGFGMGGGMGFGGGNMGRGGRNGMDRGGRDNGGGNWSGTMGGDGTEPGGFGPGNMGPGNMGGDGTEPGGFGPGGMKPDFNG